MAYIRLPKNIRYWNAVFRVYDRDPDNGNDVLCEHRSHLVLEAASKEKAIKSASLYLAGFLKKVLGFENESKLEEESVEEVTDKPLGIEDVIAQYSS